VATLEELAAESVDGLSEEDIKGAFKTTSDVTRQEDDEPKTGMRANKRKNLIKSGRFNRAPFDGLSEEDSDAIRTIVAMRFAKMTNTEAFKKAGVSIHKGYRLERDHWPAFQEAINEHLDMALAKYQSNLWIIRTALSESGPKAVQILEQLMNNRKTPAGIRLKAATSILKLLDVDKMASSGGESIQAEFLKLIKNTAKTLEGKEEYVIDAVEVEEEDGSGMGDPGESD